MKKYSGYTYVRPPYHYLTFYEGLHCPASEPIPLADVQVEHCVKVLVDDAVELEWQGILPSSVADAS